MIKRFTNETLPILDRLNIDVVGNWVVEDKPDQLVYIVRWRDRDHMDNLWKLFADDPQWISAKSTTETDGPVVKSIARTLMVSPPAIALCEKG